MSTSWTTDAVIARTAAAGAIRNGRSLLVCFLMPPNRESAMVGKGKPLQPLQSSFGANRRTVPVKTGQKNTSWKYNLSVDAPTRASSFCCPRRSQEAQVQQQNPERSQNPSTPSLALALPSTSQKEEETSHVETCHAPRHVRARQRVVRLKN